MKRTKQIRALQLIFCLFLSCEGDQDFENGLGLYESTVGQFDWIVASSKDFDKVTGVDLKDHTQETITGSIHKLKIDFKVYALK